MSYDYEHKRYTVKKVCGIEKTFLSAYDQGKPLESRLANIPTVDRLSPPAR